MTMKKDIDCKYLQSRYKTGQPCFLRLYKEWELKVLEQGTLKRYLNPLKENNNYEERCKKVLFLHIVKK